MNSNQFSISSAKLSNFVPVTDMQWPCFTPTSYAAAELMAFHYARTSVADLRDYCAVDFERELDAIECIDGRGKNAVIFRRAYLSRIYQAASITDSLTTWQVFERLYSVLTGLSGLDALRCQSMEDYVYARNPSHWEEICGRICILTEQIDLVITREIASIRETKKSTLNSQTYYPVWLLAFLFDLVNVTVRKKLR